VREVQLGEVIGQPAIDFLRIVEEATAQAGLDVRHRNTQTHGCERGGQGRVHVTVDERDIGLLRRGDLLETLQHLGRLGARGSRRELDEMIRLGQLQLVEELLGELIVVVLTRMHQDLLQPPLAGVPAD